MRQNARMLSAAILLVLSGCCSAFQRASALPRRITWQAAPRALLLSAVRSGSENTPRQLLGVPSSLIASAAVKNAKVAVFGEDVDHSEMVARRLAAALGLPFAKATQPLKLPQRGCVVGKITPAIAAKADCLKQFSCVLLLRSQADSVRMQEQASKLQQSTDVQRLMVVDADEIDGRIEDVLQQIRRMAKDGMLSNKHKHETLSTPPRSAAASARHIEQKTAKSLDEFLHDDEQRQAPSLQFAGVDLPGPIGAALDEANIRVPTAIQEMAIPAICRGSNAIVHAETGSGKTLAYLLPLMRQLFELRASGQHLSFPFAVIIVPSRELGVQVAAEVVRLAGGNQRVVRLLADERDGGEKAASLTAAPVVVGTPKRLIAATSRSRAEWSPNKPLALSPLGQEVLAHVRYLVLDEVDRLLAVPGKYAQRTEYKPRPAAVLLEHIANASKIAQVVCASATIGRLLRQQIERLTSCLRNVAWMTFSAPSGSRQTAKTTRAVTVPSTIQHFLMKTQSTAPKQWLRCVQQAIDTFQPSRCLLFVPDQQSVADTVQLLHRHNVTGASLLHEAIGFHTNRSRDGSSDGSATPIDKLKQLRKRLAGAGRDEVPVVVTTHSSARGLHFDEVDLVIVLGVPKSMDEYLHIAGRTGRAGRPGVAVSIVDVHSAKTVRSWETPLAIQVMDFPDGRSAKASARKGVKSVSNTVGDVV